MAKSTSSTIAQLLLTAVSMLVLPVAAFFTGRYYLSIYLCIGSIIMSLILLIKLWLFVDLTFVYRHYLFVDLTFVYRHYLL